MLRIACGALRIALCGFCVLRVLRVLRKMGWGWIGWFMVDKNGEALVGEYDG